MPDSLTVLAIDTAMGSCAVCCAPRGGAAAVSRCVPMPHGHATALVPMVQEVMAGAGIGFAALDLIAVTTGPGSFTGIRTGLSTARALGLAHDIPVLGLTTPEVLAQQAVAAGSADAYDGICVTIDSRRPEIFFQFFGKTGQAQTDPAMSLPESIEFPKDKKILLVGDAAERTAREGRGNLDVASRISVIDPEFLASLAEYRFVESKKAGQIPPAPQPFYLRPPDVTMPERHCADSRTNGNH